MKKALTVIAVCLVTQFLWMVVSIFTGFGVKFVEVAPVEGAIETFEMRILPLGWVMHSLALIITICLCCKPASSKQADS